MESRKRGHGSLPIVAGPRGGLRAAIYARKSTEQRIADEQKSVERQIAHAREYAGHKGWTVDDAHIYVDDGISGAEFARRPGLVRLMNALKPKPAFSALIVSELSRLGREHLETGFILKQLSQAGVRIYSYLEDREIALDSATDTFLVSALSFAAQIEREAARQRAHDKARALARAGYVSGGKCFGYDNVPVVGANGQRSHVEQRINEAEAAVIRRIFELAAIGYGQVHIAKLLNADGAPAPRSQQGRPRAWVSSSVHEALFRARYRGEIVWNRTKKRDRWGQQRASDRTEEQWLRVPAPHLRIVPQELWQAAHAKIATARSAMNLYRGRGSVSRYLLPGLARCAWCNGGMRVRTRTRSSGRHDHYYACTSHFDRGETVCRNPVEVPMEPTNRAVLEAIGDIVTPDLVDEVLDRARELQDAHAATDPRAPLEAELAAIGVQLSHLAHAIAMSGPVPALIQELRGLEQRRQPLEEALETTSARVSPPPVDWRVLERQARRMLTQWRELLADDVDGARRVLRELLDGPLSFSPVLDQHRRGYRFEGAVTIGGLLGGIAVSEGWRPRAESNCRPSA